MCCWAAVWAAMWAGAGITVSGNPEAARLLAAMLRVVFWGRRGFHIPAKWWGCEEEEQGEGCRWLGPGSPQQKARAAKQGLFLRLARGDSLRAQKLCWVPWHSTLCLAFSWARSGAMPGMELPKQRPKKA